MWGGKVKFACEVFRTDHAQIPGDPLVKDHCWTLILSLNSKRVMFLLNVKVGATLSFR